MKNKELLISIANQATFLSERIKNWIPNENKVTSPEELSLLINDWKESLTGESQQHFTERISAVSLKSENLNDLLLSNKYSSIESCPKWVSEFSSLIGIYKNDLSSSYSFILENVPIPFEDIIAPVVIYLRKECNNYTHYLSTNAREQMERSVLKSLSNLLASCFYLELYKFSDSKEMQTLDYLGFVSKFVAPDNDKYRLSFFQEYPVAARLLTTEIRNWTTFFSFFSSSIDKDYEDIKNFIGNGNLGQVQNLNVGISDKHDGGKSVIKIVFENNETIYYKPRDTGLEKEFSDFISFLNSLGHTSGFQMRVPKILKRSDYSWVEAIEFKNVTDDSSLRLYHERCGSLLYIAHLFNGTDFHYENIICNGAFPVLIDTETLLQPNTRKFKKAKESIERDLVLNSSVLMTLLLPQWQEKDDNNVYDIGGFSASFCHTGIFEPNWLNINSSDMELEFKEVFINPTTHKPSSSLDKYEEEFLKGFTEAHGLITSKRNEIINKIKKEGWFQNEQTRVVIRPTKVYAKLIERLKHPKYLRSGILYGIELEQLLINAFDTELTEEELSKWLSFYEVECDAIQEMNVPIFHVNSNQLHLYSKSKNIFPDCFLKSGTNLLIENLKNRNKNYLKTQLHFITCSIASRYSNNFFRFNLPSNDSLSKPIDLIQAASEIGDQLLSVALTKDNRVVGFSSLKYNSLITKYNLQILDNTLMAGQLGIALFFASLFDATNEGKYLNATRECLKEILTEIRDTNYLSTLHLGLDGIGGYIFGLSKIALYVKDNSLFGISKELIEFSKKIETSHFDQVFGISGLINAIIAWSKLTGDKTYYDYLKQLGNQILTRKHEDWGASLQENPITGFSHGISGISHALITLDEFLNSNDFTSVALFALAFESTFYESSLGGWKDSREFMANQSKAMFDWSHGAVGIGLARTALNRENRKASVEMDLKRVIQSLEQKEIYMNDYNLANGVLGVVDFWMEQSSSKDRLIYNVLNQFLKQELQSNDKLVRQPSLFYGASGLGYQLLRIINPERYPSILLLR